VTPNSILFNAGHLLDVSAWKGKALVIIRCMHGLIEGQCSVCQKQVQKVQTEKLQTEMNKPSHKKRKKLKN
jgi:hypothetical protein